MTGEVTATDCRVLVVDDDPDTLAIVTATLVAHGYDVRTACTGQDGLEAAGHVNPDLIVTDVLMPGMDGWALVRALRSKPETALTPVVFLSALGSAEDQLRGFRLGADDYLPKPFDPEELAMRVQRVLDNQHELGAVAVAAMTQSDLQGQLERIGMSAVLMMLEMERKSGMLTLRTDTDSCRIQLVDGQILAATVDGAEAGNAAVLHALEWSAGEFCFREQAIDVDFANAATCVNMGTTQLLLEAARRFDELSYSPVAE